jgi:predicted small metal-binding protein
MSKVLKCGDLMPGCDTVITGKDADEVLEKAEKHARKEHNMTIIPPSVVSQIEAAIKDGPG